MTHTHAHAASPAQIRSDNNNNILQAIRDAPDLEQEDVEITLGGKMQDELEQADVVSTGCPFLVRLRGGWGQRHMVMVAHGDGGTW